MSIFIFSKPIHSGKTTALQQFCAQQKDVAGILMPDVNGRRIFFDIAANEIFVAQCDDPVIATEPLENIGRFYFYANAFEKANRVLLNAAAKKNEWLIIDEAGRLEMEGKGFYPAIKSILDRNTYDNLLIVVREGLLNEMVAFFNIRHYKLIHNPDELSP